MTPCIPMSDEGKCATACHPTELRELADASDREGEKGKSEKQQIQRAYLPTSTWKRDKQDRRKARSSGKWFPKPWIFCEVLDKSVIDYTGIFISLITSQNNQSKFISNTSKIRQKPAGHSGMLMGEKLWRADLSKRQILTQECLPALSWQRNGNAVLLFTEGQSKAYPLSRTQKRAYPEIKW